MQSLRLTRNRESGRVQRRTASSGRRRRRRGGARVRRRRRVRGRAGDGPAASGTALRDGEGVVGGRARGLARNDVGARDGGELVVQVVQLKRRLVLLAGPSAELDRESIKRLRGPDSLLKKRNGIQHKTY